MSTVIQVENLSKQYRLGLVGSSTFKEDATRWWAKMLGKEDPYKDLGEENDRSIAGTSNYVWSLKDINFEIDKGDVLGIIGRNGAGKSTLLKILSKVTMPTTGSVKAKGRIASLLEVGTGFHPELTGRENIFLNGAILGMRRHEIKAKLDEIIAFSGVERYIDTPVKRYSTGMYVRLAFAVAAHLENEILIIDEVLAVGDSEFQKKCLGKVGEVSKGDGRTILFVSHNMAAVSKLCNKSILLENGRLKNIGKTFDIIKDYNNKKSNFSLDLFNDNSVRRGNGEARFIKFEINEGADFIDPKEDIIFKFSVEVFNEIDELCFVCILFNTEGTEPITESGVILLDEGIQTKGQILDYSLKISANVLRTGYFPLYFWLGRRGEIFEKNYAFDVLDKLYFLNIMTDSPYEELGYDFSNPLGFFNLKFDVLK
jgi:lipopolysaccharide transport system ATP-binding protein